MSINKSVVGTMVERVARELCRNHCPMTGQRHACRIECGAQGMILRPWIIEARAAISAMREPTEEMLTAHHKADVPAGVPHVWRNRARFDWYAMVDAALGAPAANLSPMREKVENHD